MFLTPNIILKTIFIILFNFLLVWRIWIQILQNLYRISKKSKYNIIKIINIELSISQEDNNQKWIKKL
jgi:hypothetical protein